MCQNCTLSEFSNPNPQFAKYLPTVRLERLILIMPLFPSAFRVTGDVSTRIQTITVWLSLFPTSQSYTAIDD